MSVNNSKIFKHLGEYIEQTDDRNNDQYPLESVRGISILKKLIPTKADMKDVSLNPYKILRPDEFSYVTVTSRNGGKISLAINDSKETFIVSSSYITFKCINPNELLPEYLYMLLSRIEFDRYSRFNSWGSARETFDWEELCNTMIPVPSPTIQQELVDTYNGLKSLAEDNEALIEPLTLACEAFMIECTKNSKNVELGEYIDPCEEKNTEEKYSLGNVRGISIEKKLIPTKADMQDVSLKPYKLLHPEEFSYVTVTSRNGGKISLAMNDTKETFIVSSSYVNFKCKDKTKLLPEYLFLFLSRTEFDRYSRFNSWGSARETFDWEDLCRVKIPIVDIDIQQSVVNLYNCLEEAKSIAKEAHERLNDLCPSLIQKAIHS